MSERALQLVNDAWERVSSTDMPQNHDPLRVVLAQSQSKDTGYLPVQSRRSPITTLPRLESDGSRDFIQKQQAYHMAFCEGIRKLGREGSISNIGRIHVIFPEQPEDEQNRFGFSYTPGTQRVVAVREEKVISEESRATETITAKGMTFAIRSRLHVFEIPMQGPLTVIRFAETTNGKLFMLDKLIKLEANKTQRTQVLKELQQFHTALFPAKRPGRKLNSF